MEEFSYIHSSIVDQINFIADEKNGNGVGSMKRGLNEWEPVTTDFIQTVIIVHGIQDADHVSPMYLINQLRLTLLTGYTVQKLNTKIQFYELFLWSKVLTYLQS